MGFWNCICGDVDSGLVIPVWSLNTQFQCRTRDDDIQGWVTKHQEKAALFYPRCHNDQCSAMRPEQLGWLRLPVGYWNSARHK